MCRERAAELCCHLALDSKLKCHARTCHTYTPHITYTTHKLHTRYTRSGHRSSWLCLAASSRLNAHLCVTHTHTHTSHMHHTCITHTAHTRIAHTTRTASLGNTSLPLRPPIHAYVARTHTWLYISAITAHMYICAVYIYVHVCTYVHMCGDNSITWLGLSHAHMYYVARTHTHTHTQTHVDTHRHTMTHMHA